ncbi:MAG: hypothetical protein IPG72_10350 [Ardenticatenales bacterium]|nr:hypothetical protein [Ardenticatenales bacterium]
MLPHTVPPGSSDRDAVLAALCAAHGVAILYVFGSRAGEVVEWHRGRLEAMGSGGSDVDIGVLAARDVRLDVEAKVRLAQALEALLGVERVDLISLADADPFVAANVVRGERLFAADADDADEFDPYVLRRAGDLAPLERERQRLVLADKR